MKKLLIILYFFLISLAGVKADAERPFYISEQILEEMPQAIQTYNQNAPQNEQITSKKTYDQFYKNIPHAPSYSTLYRWFKKTYSSAKGLSQFLFPKSPFLSLEKIPQAIKTYNQTAPQNQQITSTRTYHLFRYNIPNAPSYATLSKWFKKAYSSGKGLSQFLFPEKPPFLSLEEMPKAIQTYNQNAPENEQITSSSTYRLFRFNIPKAPSYDTLRSWFKKTQQSAQSLSQFLFPKSPFLSLEEMPKAIQTYNQNAPQNERITSTNTYRKFYKNIPHAPSYNVLQRRYRNNHQNEQGLSQFLFPEKPPQSKNFLSLEKMPRAIQTYNQTAPQNQQIIPQTTYKQFYKNIPHAPSYDTLYRWFKKTYSSAKGLSQFLFSGKTPCSGSF